MTTRKAEALYHLVKFNPTGFEIPLKDNSYTSEKVVDHIEKQDVSDVFLISHGWQGDLNGAYKQYDQWYEAVAQDFAGIISVDKKRSGKFSPLVVGIHWPSLVGGDERARAIGGPEASMEDLIAFISDDGSTQNQLRAIANNVSAACAQAPTVAAHPGARAFPAPDIGQLKEQLAQAAAKVGNAINANVGRLIDKTAEIAEYAMVKDIDPEYAFMKLLSFWRMREMARQVGERGGYKLLCKMQSAVRPGQKVRFHLIGHSFGCIVVSAVVAGTNTDDVKNVDTVLLLQGALALWSYSKDDPNLKDVDGHSFPALFADLSQKVNRAIVSTRADNDRAVGWGYPVAARLWELGAERQIAALPNFGALGAFGAQGDGIQAVSLDKPSQGQHYNFSGGKYFNVNASNFIEKDLDPFSGAHCDIANPGVAQLLWDLVASVD
jgi:hypothetical protein